MTDRTDYDGDNTVMLMALPKTTLAQLSAAQFEIIEILRRATVAAQIPKAGKVRLGRYFLSINHGHSGRPRKSLSPPAISMANSAYASIPENKLDRVLFHLFALAVGQQLLGSGVKNRGNRKAIREALKTFGVPEAELEERMLKIARRVSEDRKLLLRNPKLADQLDKIASGYIARKSSAQAE